MRKNSDCRNDVEIVGTITSEPKEENTFKGTTFYNIDFKSRRLSGKYDHYTVRVTDSLLRDCDFLTVGSKVKIQGAIRTYTYINDENSIKKTRMFILVNTVTPVPADTQDFCSVSIKGFVCRVNEEREINDDNKITDFCIACNRGAKSDYIQSIAWNGLSRFIQKDIMVGDVISCEGRVNSRTYNKFVEGSEEPIEIEVNEFCVATARFVKKGKAHLIKDGEWVEPEKDVEKTEEVAAEVVEADVEAEVEETDADVQE